MARPDRHGSVPPAVLVLALMLAWELACGAGDPPPVASPAPIDVARLEAFSGDYEVRGVTVQALSGTQREIAGSLRLDVTDQRYRVEFALETTAPDFEEPLPVDVRGSGLGFIVGDLFTGTTQEWMSLQTSAGLDEVELRGVELPARAGRKIVSTSRASFDADGVFQIVMENFPGPGERYEPSMTVLQGRRAGPAPSRESPAEAPRQP